MTYVMELRIPQGTLLYGLYEDTDNPYHYMRIEKGNGTDDVVLLGGADHRMDIHIDDARCFAALERYFREVVPGVEYTLVRQWKGMIVEPGDGLAYIGTLKDPRLFYATGYSGNGITYAVIAARLFADSVLGRRSDLAGIYDAGRPLDVRAHMKGARHYLGEFLGGMRELYIKK